MAPLSDSAPALCVATNGQFQRENHALSCLTQLIDCTVGSGQVRPHTQPYTHLAQNIPAGSTCWVLGLALHCVIAILQNMVVCRRPCNAEIHTSTLPAPILQPHIARLPHCMLDCPHLHTPPQHMPDQTAPHTRQAVCRQSLLQGITHSWLSMWSTWPVHLLAAHLTGAI